MSTLLPGGATLSLRLHCRSLRTPGSPVTSAWSKCPRLSAGSRAGNGIRGRGHVHFSLRDAKLHPFEQELSDSWTPGAGLPRWQLRWRQGPSAPRAPTSTRPEQTASSLLLLSAEVCSGRHPNLRQPCHLPWGTQVRTCSPQFLQTETWPPLPPPSPPSLLTHFHSQICFLSLLLDFFTVVKYT